MLHRRVVDEALAALREKVKSAYQHVVYLSQPEPHLPRTLAVETFDNDLQGSLDGTTVWKLLVDQVRAFDQGQFTGSVLLLNLREETMGVRSARFVTPSGARLRRLLNYGCCAVAAEAAGAAGR